MPFIRIRGLTKLYRMGESIVRALDGVDLDIERGEFVAITGASGSGKSTMMHLIGCLDRPTAGTFVFSGREVGSLSDRELAEVRNKQIGFVFQTFNLINRTTALENVAVPLFYARVTHTRAAAMRALERVGLGPRATHKPSELSGGERQRVAIARAIVNDPPLLLADEPTGNLDTRTGKQIMQIFRELNAQGVTIVLVTHEYDVAIQTRRIVQMRDGKIVSDRLTADLLDDHQEPHTPPREAADPDSVSEAAEPAANDSARPAAIPAGVSDSEHPPKNVAAVGSPRLARGATSALVCGVSAPTMIAIALLLGVLIELTGFDRAAHNPKKLPPVSVILLGCGSSLALLVAVGLAIAAILWGRGVLRRAHEQPGDWSGLGRAKAARILGWATAALLLLGLTVNIAGCLWRATHAEL